MRHQPNNASGNQQHYDHTGERDPQHLCSIAITSVNGERKIGLTGVLS
jgi:hypothetical protein